MLGDAAPKPVLRVVAIPGQPLPVIVARQQGMFEQQGIDVQIHVVPSSKELRSELASGQADVAHAAVDNAVAMAISGKNVVVVMGGQGSLNELITQPTIHTFAQLRGRKVTVDAPTTAFALQLIYILQPHGLRPGRDYQLVVAGTTPQRFVEMKNDPSDAATMLGPPWSILAKHDGFVSLGATPQLMGPYQSIGAFTMRSWASKHAGLLERYLTAYIEAQRWLMAPSNKDAVVALLEKHYRLPAWAAKETYALLAAKNHEWYEKDAALNIEGFRNVLKIRAETEGDWGGHPPPARNYYDLSYYDAALARLKSRH